MYNSFFGYCTNFILFTTFVPVAVSQVYPSAGTAWVINGQQQAATAPQFKQQFNSATAVSQWEDTHADISIGGSNKQFSEQAKVTLDLPGHYQRLNANGSLSEVIDKITLTGYQGVILILPPPLHIK